MKGAKILFCFILLLSLVLGACSAPTATPTPDPRPALETMVAATLKAAAEATSAVDVPVPAPSLAPSQTPVSADAFEARLRSAVAARDFAALTPLLGEPFEISTWQAGGGQMPAAEAGDRLRNDLLASRAEVSFSANLPAGVEAAEPPGIKSVRRLSSSGWGRDGLGEAVLTIGEGTDGRMAWQSVLFAPAGFNPPPPASVKGVINVASANLRSGPSPLHTLVAPYAMGTPMTISYATPGLRWGNVTAPDGKEGWLLLSLLDLEGELETLPIHPGTPSDSIPVVGWVQGGSGQPIDKAVVSIWQEEGEEASRPLAFTGMDGMFYLYLPEASTGSWTIGVMSIDCTSSVMDEQCAKQAEFEKLTQTITLPLSKPVVFVYNNILGDTAAVAAEGCPAAEPGKLPLNNSQDGYCLLYPEGFTIRQPATSILEIVGPSLDQGGEPLAARLTIQKKALPGGSSLETVAAALWSEGRSPFSQNPITLSGEPGLYADHLMIGEAPFEVRQIVVIRGDSYYILTFAPFDDTDPFSKALPDQEKLWNTVTSSFQFLP